MKIIFFFSSYSVAFYQKTQNILEYVYLKIIHSKNWSAVIKQNELKEKLEKEKSQ